MNTNTKMMTEIRDGEEAEEIAKMTAEMNLQTTGKPDVEATETIRKIPILVGQYHTSVDDSMAWATITCDERNQMHIHPYDKAADGTGEGPATMIPYPGNLHNHDGVAAVCCRSKLFFISGLDVSRGGNYPTPWKKLKRSDTVCAFDTNTRTWDTFQYKPIQTPRWHHLAVFVKGCDDKDRICVFGSSDQLPEEHWAEEYIFSNNEWAYLPPPPKDFNIGPIVETHAVTFWPKLLILFPLPARPDFTTPIVAYDPHKREWSVFCKPYLPISHPEIFPTHTILMPDKLTVIEGVLLWFCNGSIWGLDLVTKTYTGPVYNRDLPDDLKGEPEAHYPQVYLLSTESNELFLIWSTHQVNICQIRCFKFKVNRLRRPRTRERSRYIPFFLELESKHVFDTESIGRSELRDALILL